MLSFSEDLVVRDPFPVDVSCFYTSSEGSVFILDIVNVSLESCKHLVRCHLETHDRDLPC